MIVRVSEGFPRALTRLNIVYGSIAARCVSRTINAMAVNELPSKQDVVTSGGQIIVRKVAGWRIWVWTTNDGVTLTIVTLTGEPPIS